MPGFLATGMRTSKRVGSSENLPCMVPSQVPAVSRSVACTDLAGDSQAYSYLPNSVKRFPGPEELAATMARCGLGEIRYVLTAGGIIALHQGVAP